jgi:hypothetical protein
MENYDCNRDPFSANPNESIHSITEEEQLTDLPSKTSLKIKLPTMSLTEL